MAERSSRKYGAKVLDADKARHLNSKDTKRWCKGRIGVEHKYEWTPEVKRWRSKYNIPWREENKCSNCGRVSDTRRPKFTIGELLRMVRESSGWTQEEVGKACGMEQSVISNIEQGKNSMSLDTLKRVGTALRVVVEVRIHDAGEIYLTGESNRW